MAHTPTKKQLAWRKKFAAIQKAKSKKSKAKKRKAKISGTTSIRIPTKRKSRTVNVKRANTGKFTSVGEINNLKNTILNKLETQYGDAQVKLLKADKKSKKNKIKKEISEIRKRITKVIKTSWN